MLRDLIAWQERHGYPMTFFTEASLDLADDPELMSLMVEANIASVFVGIESPNESSLRETKKFQNVRAGGTLVEKVHRIQEAGMEVWCGMILGFDHDDETIFDAQLEFIAEARIINVMLGMLSAIPKTPLYDRMAEEGRLDLENEAVFGTNVIPLRLGREQLREGFVRVLSELNAARGLFRPAGGPLPRGRDWTSAAGRTGTGGAIRGTEPGQGAVPGPGPRLPGAAALEGARSGAAPRVPQADLAARPSPARPEHPLDRRRQVAPCSTMPSRWPGRWPRGRRP